MCLWASGFESRLPHHPAADSPLFAMTERTTISHHPADPDELHSPAEYVDAAPPSNTPPTAEDSTRESGSGDGAPSFASRWRGKFSPAERDDDPRYRALARKYLR